MKPKTIKLYLSWGWVNLEGSCFLSVKENFFSSYSDERILISLITKNPAPLQSIVMNFKRLGNSCWKNQALLSLRRFKCFVLLITDPLSCKAYMLTAGECVCVCLTPKTEISEKPQSRRCNDSATNAKVCLDGCHIVIFFKHVFLV